MQGILDVGRVFAWLFLIALPLAIVIAIVLSFAVDWARKKAVKLAQEQGAELSFKPDPGPSIAEIEGIFYCIGIIIVGAIIVVAAVLGISLPIEVSEDVQNLIATIVAGVFDVMLWAIIIWSPYYYISEKRRIKRKLDEALSNTEL